VTSTAGGVDHYVETLWRQAVNDALGPGHGKIGEGRGGDGSG
jgi:hypothetical protein